MAEVRNIGIFAHVDAGKTTLSEQLLVHTGALKKAGSVDSGTAHTDALEIERRRGISVKATSALMTWHGTQIRLIDTPGHMDFSAEVERSFWALDAAILVVDAAEGVQPQTELLFTALREQGMPILFFLNKMDREQADADRTLRQLQDELTRDIAPLWDPDALAEAVCGADDALLERFLAGEEIPKSEILTALARLSRTGRVYPALYGSALRDRGIDELLNAVAQYLPPPADAGALCGVVFASGVDRVMGRGVYVRLFGGRLTNRMPLVTQGRVDPRTSEAQQVERKITQIRDLSGADMGELLPGGVGIVYGLGDLPIGYVFGDKDLLPRHVEPGRFRTPLIAVQVIPEKSDDMQTLREACAVLSQEDPLLQAEYDSVRNEERLRAMGTVQLEIIEDTLRTRFGISVHFGEPTVLYRETIAQSARGFVAYTWPKPCWAIIECTIEPAPNGSGVSFTSEVPVRDILMRYQHQVEQALPNALRQGRLGWPVTDVRITLTGGSHHQFHTHPLDFIVATPMMIQDGLRQGGSVLLEPILEVYFLLPPDCVGRVMSDIAKMRGETLETLAQGERVRMRALLPVRTSMNYPTELAALSSGRAGMSVRLHGYSPCPIELGSTAPRRGVDPLDTSKYILAARSALEGGIFDY